MAVRTYSPLGAKIPNNKSPRSGGPGRDGWLTRLTLHLECNVLCQYAKNATCLNHGPEHFDGGLHDIH